jgi:hypothetical protein
VVPVNGTFLGRCVFSTSNTGTDIGQLTGSKNTKSTATFDIHASISSDRCGNGAWEGNYIITTPDYLDVYFRARGGEKPGGSGGLARWSRSLEKLR